LFTYKGSKTKEISFPLGGIGTGCIGLSGNGSLIDWEIFNKPNKGTFQGFTHFAVKAERRGEVIDARVLNGDVCPPYTGMHHVKWYNGYGFGVDRATLSGLPHFSEVVFNGEYPLANLQYVNSSFPGEIGLLAFNPLIPMNDKDSSIPAAFFEFEIENTTDEELTYSLAFVLSSPFKKTKISWQEKKLHLENAKDNPGSHKYGNFCITSDHDELSFQEYWYRGSWFDDLNVYWQDFTKSGKFKNRYYSNLEERMDSCVLAAHKTLAPGEKGKVRFILSWSMPTFQKYWDQPECKCDGECELPTWKNYYATQWKDSKDSAEYALNNWQRLYEETLLFHDNLFGSTVPKEVLDAVSSNISILKSPTCLRLEDGSFYGFEGCFCDGGCCEGSCTHVWNYAQALPFLFPKLERSMRDLDYKYNMLPDGGMSFRLKLPIGADKWAFRPCVDGHFGGIIKLYRDWKISGKDDWMKSHWEAVKRNIAYAWNPESTEKWDLDMNGVIEGRQHHTLDMELFGPNAWLTGIYLAALKAACEMGDFLGDTEATSLYRKLFNSGRAWVDENLFNGKYYFHQINLEDKSILDQFSGASVYGNDYMNKAYWNEEAGEIKYQMGEGCAVDQVLGQWLSNVSCLGEVLDKSHVRSALKSIYDNNFRSMRDFFNPCRLYSLNDEEGVIICSWPEGSRRPVVPAPYSEETMNGFEYQAAVHMIQEGMVEEGLEIVRSIRNRYDGERRNPWNEFECGSNYARSMASYALINAFTGLTFDLSAGHIGFDPIRGETQDNFKGFWSVGEAWGNIVLSENEFILNVVYGNLDICSVFIPKDPKEVYVDGKSVPFSVNKGRVVFNETLRVIQRINFIYEGVFL